MDPTELCKLIYLTRIGHEATAKVSGRVARAAHLALLFSQLLHEVQALRTHLRGGRRRTFPTTSHWTGWGLLADVPHLLLHSDLHCRQLKRKRRLGTVSTKKEVNNSTVSTVLQ